MNHRRVAQSSYPDAPVYMYELDTSKYGGPLYHWTHGPLGGSKVMFGGVVFEPLPILLEGIEHTGQGAIPRPKITLPNINNFASQLVSSYNDLLGCKITRKYTFQRFLDGQMMPDPTAYFGPDVWYVDRVAVRSRDSIQWELASALDIQGKQLPGRQVIRDACTHTYRTYNAAGGFFIQGSCPYAGAFFFKADGSGTDNPAEDVCGKRLRDDTLRFPDQPLPTRAFPGVGRVRAA